MISVIKKGGALTYSNAILCGKSNDTKPIDKNIPNGSIFKEIDTSKEYIYDAESSEWYETI